MNSHYDVLVDSDAFIGWLDRDDAHHSNCVRLFERLRKNNYKLVTTNFLIAEVTTALSRKVGQKLTNRLIDELKHWVIIELHTSLFNEALKLFQKQAKKGTSFFDCSNVVVMKNFQIPHIFSFDRFYDRKMGLQLLS